MAGTDLYLYGVVRSDRPLPSALGGVGSPPEQLRLVSAGSTAAVVSAAPPGLRARRRDLLAHRDLLLALADGGLPVLPMRFGSVAPDEETVRKELVAAESSHLESLERVAGRHELNVKAAVTEDGMAMLLREDPHVRRLRDEVRRSPGYDASIRLGEAVAAGLQDRARRAAGEVMGDLAVLAVESAEGPVPAVHDSVRSTSFLVDAERQDAFRAAAERLATRHREALVLRVTGPLPCYSFVSETASSGRRAAAEAV
ncbi:GvpL/GvpF family gas vesicle protein [Streptomyces sp. DSM 42041]|uniref:GvpL/GvpF family gas vesicle protein n=1 Tax=Streptomyces hazeniae TaxID=3075538 RepID=A0ABU2NZE6_9ACTN|nr:GvpL/GvpF family gas vesicle protein [Streptomyces sp. DSM 42041]MDT0382344.1 GvpL/GvpF family gas vesicle protein [Streptomyces sp. DSM 42041]